MPNVMGTRRAVLYSGLAVVAISPLGISNAEIGDVGVTTLEAVFNQNVNATDYKAGVTIKINAISQTINTATRQDPDKTRVHYVIAAAADVDDGITWQYDDDFGDYEDDEGNPMADQIATSATNYIGAHLYFDTPDDAIWVGGV